MEMWFWVLGWFFCIITMIVNGFVIFLVWSQRQLCTKTNAFVVSLAVAGFGVVMIVVPSHFFSAALQPNALHALNPLKYLTLIFSKIFFGVMFFL